MADQGWTLGDGEAAHRDFPRTFSIPRSAVRNALPLGCQARLIFRLKAPQPDAPRAERMWCRVVSHEGDWYVGTLVNQAVYLTDLKPGTEIRFQARHVIAVVREDDRRMPALAGGDLGVLCGGLQPHWLVRVPSTDARDSGWRVLSAEPTLPLRACSAETLFDAWPALDTVLDGLTHGAWQWSEDALEYVEVATAPEAITRASTTPLGRLHVPAALGDKQAIVTRRVLETFPQCAERTPPSKDPSDSGWSFLVGDESARELDEAKNFTAVPLRRLLVLYPILERLFAERGEGRWLWREADGDFTSA